MRYLEEVKDMLCRELEEITRHGQIRGPQELDAIDKLTHSIKSIDTIIAMEDAGYSNDYRPHGTMKWTGGGSYDDGSYRGRMGNGRYMRNSYDDPYYMGYSRHDAKEHMIEQMREAILTANTEETKEALRKAITLLDKEQSK